MQRKWESKYSTLKSNQDSRLRQLDRFEGALKSSQDGQKTWKARLVLKSGEIEAHKVGPFCISVFTNNEAEHYSRATDTNQLASKPYARR